MPRKTTPSPAAPAPTPAVPLNFLSPESSNIAGASWCPETQEMIVGFHSHKPDVPPREYVYQGISLAVWTGFVHAESRGGSFALAIKPVYTGVKR